MAFAQPGGGLLSASTLLKTEQQQPVLKEPERRSNLGSTASQSRAAPGQTPALPDTTHAKILSPPSAGAGDIANGSNAASPSTAGAIVSTASSTATHYHQHCHPLPPASPPTASSIATHCHRHRLHCQCHRLHCQQHHHPLPAASS